jgi:hypothetical protein
MGHGPGARCGWAGGMEADTGGSITLHNCDCGYPLYMGSRFGPRLTAELAGRLNGLDEGEGKCCFAMRQTTPFDSGHAGTESNCVNSTLKPGDCTTFRTST